MPRIKAGPFLRVVVDNDTQRKVMLAKLRALVAILDLENLADATEYVQWLIEVQRDYHARWGVPQGESANGDPAA